MRQINPPTTSPPHRCCASTLPIQNARQPSWAFCCALGGWWLGRCGVAGAPGAHLQGGQGPNVGWRAFYTGIFGNQNAHRKQQKYTHSQGQNPHLHGCQSRRETGTSLPEGHLPLLLLPYLMLLHHTNVARRQPILATRP